jgi:hypothetical protein
VRSYRQAVVSSDVEKKESEKKLVEKKVVSLFQYNNPCYECESGFILDKKTGQCWSPTALENYELVNLHCTEMYDGVCVKCEKGYEKSPEGLCIILHCLIPAHDNFNCSVCNTGYYIVKMDSEKGPQTECKPCTDSDTRDECQLCPSGTRLKVNSQRTDTICFPKIEGCLTYDVSEEKCLKCNSDFLLSSDKKYCFHINYIDSTTCKLMIENKIITYNRSEGECTKYSTH